MRGRFITFEGGEGAGKSTQARALADNLESRGLSVVLTREPGGTPGAEALRTLLLGGKPAFSPLAETLMHFAARAEHVDRLIRPALASGTWVVCDRFTDSTVAYQGHGQGVDRAFIHALSEGVGLRPDLTIVLHVPVGISMARLAARGGDLDRYERLGADFFGRVAAAFRAIVADHPERCVGIDGAGDAPDVAGHVMHAVRTRLGLPA